MYNYETDFENLIRDTPRNKHNELILSVDSVEIIGYYGQHKKFAYACECKNLPLYNI